MIDLISIGPSQPGSPLEKLQAWRLGGLEPQTPLGRSFHRALEVKVERYGRGRGSDSEVMRGAMMVW